MASVGVDCAALGEEVLCDFGGGDYYVRAAEYGEFVDGAVGFAEVEECEEGVDCGY